MRALALIAALGGCSYNPRTVASSSDGAMLDVPGPPPGVWLEPWAHRKAFSILGSQVAAALTSFPVVISIDDSDLATSALASGADIVFTAGDATTVLDSELEQYAAGQLVAWVRIPTLPSGTDTPLFMYYGNLNPPQRNPPAAVWASSFTGVWHLQQAPDAGANNEIADSSAGNRAGSAQSTMVQANSVNGQLGRAITFDGVDDTLKFGSIDLTSTFTISAWVDVDDGNGIRTVFANSGAGGGTDGIRFFINDAGTANKRIIVETGDGGGGALCTTATGAITASSFHQLVAVIDRAAGSGQLFVDGMDKTGAGTASVRTNFSVSTDFEIGSLKNNIQAGMAGILDEVTIASTARPHEWIETTFANQHVPSAFFSAFGNEEQAPP